MTSLEGSIALGLRDPDDPAVILPIDAEHPLPTTNAGLILAVQAITTAVALLDTNRNADDDALRALVIASNTALASVIAKLSADPATQATLAAVLAKMAADPSTGAKQDAIRDRLPAALHGDGGAKVHVQNPPDVSALALDATVATLSAKLGIPASDDMLVLLRAIATNTATETTTVGQLKLTADQVQLNTDTLETLLATTNARLGTTATAGSVAQLVEAVRALLASPLAVSGPATDSQLRATPLPVAPSSAKPPTFTAKGYRQVTIAPGAAGSLTTGGASIPSGAKFADITFSGAAVAGSMAARYRDDATDPTATVGKPVFGGAGLFYDGDDLTALRVFAVGAALVLDVAYYA